MKKTIAAVLLLLAAGACLLGLMHQQLDTSPWDSSFYNSYTRQAIAWREGAFHLPEDVPYLELAIYEGEYYVSFPPVPTLPELLCTFFWGMDTPDNALVAFYGLMALLGIFYGLRKQGFSRLSSALYGFFLTFASCLLPLFLTGAVWYQAQTLAFALTVWAIALVSAGHSTPGLFLYALAVGCRPFNVMYGPAMMLIFCLDRKEQGLTANIKKMSPGIGLRLCVAAAYAVFNYLRFGNPLEFGHNYLPEFSTQGGVQFSLDHVAKNAETFLLGWPFDASGQFEKFGFSLFIACPALAYLVLRTLWDGVRRQLTWQRGIVFLCFAAQLFALLLHRTFGGFQFGARYTADLIPYMFMYVMTKERKRFTWHEGLLYAAGLAFSIWGTLNVHL
ncbi:MAG: hypothetical protein IJ461_05690 [Clostridia bacterium]|nr:hypothetical protein [Clostridia bacterium]